MLGLYGENIGHTFITKLKLPPLSIRKSAFFLSFPCFFCQNICQVLAVRTELLLLSIVSFIQTYRTKKRLYTRLTLTPGNFPVMIYFGDERIYIFSFSRISLDLFLYFRGFKNLATPYIYLINRVRGLYGENICYIPVSH